MLFIGYSVYVYWFPDLLVIFLHRLSLTRLRWNYQSRNLLTLIAKHEIASICVQNKRAISLNLRIIQTRIRLSLRPTTPSWCQIQVLAAITPRA